MKCLYLRVFFYVWIQLNPNNAECEATAQKSVR
jgi:hypothetical protein